MNTRSRAQNRADHSPSFNSFGQRAESFTSAQEHSSSNNDQNAHSAFRTNHAYGDTLENLLRSSAQTNGPQSDCTSAHGVQASWPPHVSGLDPSAQHFAGYGGPTQPISPENYAHGPGMPQEEDPVSPLHVGLIVMILLAGLAIGIWRTWMVDEKLETSSAKKPIAAAGPSVAAVNDASSLQSSIDRAYIPPALRPEDGQEGQMSNNSQIGALAIDPGPVNAPSSPSTAPKASLNAEHASKSAQEVTSASSPKIAAMESAPKMMDSRPARSEARKEEARKSGKTGSSQKVASSTRKERLKEIDRVRTQAFSETSKDRVGERKSKPESQIGPQSQRRSDVRTSKVVQNLVTSSQYARCERIDHIIRREKCKWELCNNKWGKGACPSFKHDRPFLF